MEGTEETEEIEGTQEMEETEGTKETEESNNKFKIKQVPRVPLVQ